MLAPAPNLALAPDTGEDVGMASLYRRDKGRGSTTLVRWVYSDSAQTTDPLRPELAKLERWLSGAFEKGAGSRAGSA